MRSADAIFACFTRFFMVHIGRPRLLLSSVPLLCLYQRCMLSGKPEVSLHKDASAPFRTYFVTPVLHRFFVVLTHFCSCRSG